MHFVRPSSNIALSVFLSIPYVTRLTKSIPPRAAIFCTSALILFLRAASATLRKHLGQSERLRQLADDHYFCYTESVVIVLPI